MGIQGRSLRIAAAFLALLAVPARAALAASAPVVVAAVGNSSVSPPIAGSFVGLSLEFPAVRAYTGTNARAINPLLVQLIRNLSPSASPVLRIGGDSTDQSWWPAHGIKPPAGVSYELTSGWMRTTRALAVALHARLILGVNLAAGEPQLAAAEARAFRKRIGRRYIEALEVGNEPDLYGIDPWYVASGGAAVFARSPSYDLQSYINQFSSWRAALPSVPLTGPALAHVDWYPELGQFLSAEPAVRLATVHRYPLRACEQDPSSPLFATIPNLLSDSSTTELAQPLTDLVQVAGRHHAAVRVDELNSASCRGKIGVSNTFAAALWALDTLFAFARTGVTGVNFHTLPGAAYELFTFAHSGRRWHASIRPEYYGLELFAQAAPAGSRLLSVRAPAGPVKVWATRASDGTVRVVMINEDSSSSQLVYLKLPFPGARAPSLAAVEYLRAPALAATRGVTLGGSAISGRTGLLARTPRVLRVTAYAKRIYAIELPPASAALLIR